MKTTRKYDLALAAILGLTTVLVWHNSHSGHPAPTKTIALANAPHLVSSGAGLSRSAQGSAASGGIQILGQADLAPAWTIKYGAEFWHRSHTELASANQSDNVHSTVTPPFSIGDVIERVDHSLAANNAGAPEVNGGNYVASFDTQGLHFSPDSLSTTQPATPQPDPATEITFQTASIQQGATTLYSPTTSGTEWSALGNTAQALLSPNQGVVEHFETLNDGVSVAWIFPQSLTSGGDVDVTMSVGGLSYAGETADGFHYADANGNARVRVSNAFAVDSDGNRWVLPMQAMADSGQLTVTLPVAVQAQAVYPLAIDPIISPEISMDTPVPAPATGTQSHPAVAFARGTFLVVWGDNRNAGNTGSDVYGARVSSTGTVLDPVGIAISADTGSQSNPTVAATTNLFLVVWQDNRLGPNTTFGARVTPGGTVLDPQAIALSTATAGESSPTVAAGSTNFLVAWQDNRNFGTNGAEIYGTIVSTNGLVTVSSDIAISTNGVSQVTPAAVGSKSGYFVVWQDSRNNASGDDIYGARVSPAGVTLDTNGVPICTVTNNQTQPALAINKSGTVLVAWRDRRTSKSTSDDIYGALVNFTNNSVNVEQSNSIPICTVAGSQKSPAVCTLTNEFLVVWDDQRNSGSTSDDIYGARVDTNGVVLDVGGFPICTNAATQTAPAIAMGVATNGALVVWTDSRNADTSTDIYGTRISPTGVVLDTNDVAISLNGAAEVNPAVAFNGTNYLVVWEDYRNYAVSGSDIRGARVSSSKGGTVLDPAGIVICNQAANQQHPSVAASGTEYLVAWEDSRNSATTGVDIYGSRVSTSGAVLDPAGLAISTAANDEQTPVVAGNNSTFFVAWQDNRNNSTSPDIFGTPVSSTGIIQNSSGIAISQTGSSEENPAIAACGDQFLVVWDDTSDVYASRIGNDGTVFDTSGSALQLADIGSELMPSVAALGTNYLIAWQDGRDSSSDIFAGRVFGDGTVADFEGFPICTLPNDQTSPSVGAASNNWVVAFQNTGANDGNDLYCARVLANGTVQDFLSVPLLGTADRTGSQLAFGNGQFLLVSDAFRTNSDRVVASLMSPDPAPANVFVQFSSVNYSVSGSTKVAKVTVNLSAKVGGEVTVDFSTSDGTGVAGTDYLPVAGRLVFANGQVSATVSIPIIGNLASPANKTVNLNLSNIMGGAQFGPRNAATLTIVE